jgi:hypothetical protein
MAGVPDWYESVLTLQLKMNAMSWSALQEHGADETSQLQLDFFYVAPSEDAGNELRRFLQAETDYAVEVRSQKAGVLTKRTWSVVGHTQKTTVSLEILNAWVEWMVAAGAQHGACEFDGWGAEAP